MIVYFADRKLNILGLASTKIPDSILIDNDSQVIDIDTGVVTFEFDLYYTKGGRLEAEEMTTPGNYVLRKDGEEQRLFQIVDAEADNVSGQINVYAEDAGLDLLGAKPDYGSYVTRILLAHAVQLLPKLIGIVIIGVYYHD